MKVTMKAARTNAGLSQEQLAQMLEVNRASVSNWESGKSIPSIKTFLKYCQCVGCSPDDIFLPSETA